jgi:BMFP domain-containing protein YqiC
MTDSNQIQDEWSEMVEQMNDAVAESIEQNMEAQATFMESWTDVFDDSVPEEGEVAEGIEGYSRAYEVWMDAAEQMLGRTTDIAEGEDVDPTEFRDIWLQSANEAFKEVMETSAFAAANGQLVEAMMEMQQEVDDVTQDTVAQMGMPTRDDIDEVGERLVELERRQHEVEQKLDRVIDALEE